MKIATTLMAAALTFTGAGVAYGATATATQVYEGLLASRPVTVPRGFSSASTKAVRLSADDARNGMIGAVQIDFAGATAGTTAQIRYAVFAQAGDATKYSEQVSQSLTARGGQRIFFPYFPGADCVTSGGNQVCTRASGDVFILAVSTGIVSANTHEHQLLRGDSAGNVGRIALAYLDSVRDSIGQVGPAAPPSRSPVHGSTSGACAIMTAADASAAMSSPVGNPRQDATGTCYYASQSSPGDGVSVQLLAGGRKQFDWVRGRLRGVVPLSGVGDAAFEFVSAAGFVQVYAVRKDQYFMVTFFERSARDPRRTAAALAQVIATRIRS